MKKTFLTMLLIAGLVALSTPLQAMASSVEPSAGVGIDWMATLSANYSEEGKMYNSVGWAGVAPDSLANNDILDSNYDTPVPPASPAPSVVLKFYHPSPAGPFSRDIRLATVAMAWRTDVSASSDVNDPTTITLTWDVSSVPSDRTVQLKKGSTLATATLEVANMRTASQYTYDASAYTATRFWFVADQNQPPLATVTYANGGEKIKGVVDVTATATDSDGTVSSVAFDYSPDNGTTWTAIGTDTTSPYSASWDTSLAADGNQYLIRATASDDKFATGSDNSNATFIVDNTAPGVPSLVGPGNDSYTNDTTPMLDWSDVADVSGVTYNAELANNATFTSPIPLTGMLVSEFTQGPLAEGKWYWRVKAVNGVALESAWGGPWSFTVDTTAPPAPVQMSPASGAFTNDTTPTLDWSDVSDSSGSQVGYNVALDGDGYAGWNVGLSLGAASQLTVPPPMPLPEGVFYWKVNAFDAAGNTSSYSANWSFRVDTTLPGAPAPSAPADGSLTNDNTPTMDWSDVADPTGVSYGLQVDDSADFGTPVVNGPVSKPYTTGALADGTYYWKVNATDGAGNVGAWSSPVWSFTVDATAPGVPPLLGPVNGYMYSGGGVHFEWASVSDPSGVSYRLEIAQNTGFSPLVFSTPDLYEYTFNHFVNLEFFGDGVYYWRVAARDGAGNWSAWSAVRSLTIDTAAPGAPVPLTPADAAYVNSATPALTWTELSDPTGVFYLVEVASDAGFSSIVASQGGLTVATWTVSPALSEGSYYWRVRATDGAGNQSGWSIVWSFSVDVTAPPVPSLIGPLEGAVVASYTPTFEWSTVTDLADSGIAGYQLVASKNADYSSPAIDVIVSGGTYTPIGNLGDGLYYWRVRAKDGAGNYSGWASRTFTIEVLVVKTKTFPAGWNMLSLPVDPRHTSGGSDFASDDVFGDEYPGGAGLFMFWYNPAKGGYDTWLVSNKAFGAGMGRGYWLRLYSSMAMDVKGYPAADEDYVIPLSVGWNMIGHPHLFNVNLSEIKVRQGSTVVSLLEAHPNLVLKYVYGYNPSTGGYETMTAPDGQLKPWLGYWVLARQAVDLLIPPIPAPPPSPE